MVDLRSLSRAWRGLTIAAEDRCANRPARIADRRGRLRSPDPFAEWCAWKRWPARARPRHSTTCSRPSCEPARSSRWMQKGRWSGEHLGLERPACGRRARSRHGLEQPEADARRVWGFRMPVLLPSQSTGEVTPGPLRRPPPRVAPLPRACAPSSSGPRRGALRAGRPARAVLGRTFAAPYTAWAVLARRPALSGRATQARPSGDPGRTSRAHVSRARPRRHRGRPASWSPRDADVLRRRRAPGPALARAPADRAGKPRSSLTGPPWAAGAERDDESTRRAASPRHHEISGSVIQPADQR